jgi:hypothetical protein
MNPKQNFFYKGIDGYTAETRYELTVKASRSAYRWWFETLRCSRDYWWVCEQRGETLDPDLKRVWEHFGDVFTSYFETWWDQTGHHIFAERVGPPRIESVNEFVAMQCCADEKVLVLAVPLLMTDKVLKRNFSEVLAFHRGREIRSSDALFPLRKTSRIRLGVIEQALRVWLHRHTLDHESGINRSELGWDEANSNYQIGELLDVSPKHRKRPGDPLLVQKKKERVMRVAVSRATSRAVGLISNAEIGVFPSFIPVAGRERWTTRQAQSLEKAVKRGKWTAPGFSKVDSNSLRIGVDQLINFHPFGFHFPLGPVKAKR